ncbi:MAG TPA: aminomethyl-transferring glycine dehydrogenase subunit GcvPA [Candidatus Acidoferrales bacterium]|nr:aminomethyl-transferring glycine dehydrogenase subunit GcvPA [Candidatus Acidoferrales bacterium]
MPYYPNTDDDRHGMLEAIGVKNFHDLIKDIPEEIRLKADLKIPPAMSELEVVKHLSALADKNVSTQDAVSFLGAGAYDHFIPSAVGALLSRSEFYTAYTPYQAEVSQGTLQAIYEYQTMICRLTGMDISNASLYDAGSGLAEAALMSAVHTGRRKIVAVHPIHPLYLQVVRTYVHGQGFEIVEIPAKDGAADVDAVKKNVDESAAAVMVQQPSFFGTLSDVFALAEIARSKKALFVVGVNPISLGLLVPPGEYGADVVIGEGQPLGIPQSFGGPFLGIFAVREELIRRLPGRLAGITVDAEGNRGFVLTLQTREQQIRREKATSNICTNEGLMMLASTIYMSLMGKQGIREVAEQSSAKAHYLAEQIGKIPGFKLKYREPFFNEFLVSTPVPAEKIIDAGVGKKILAGLDVGRLIPDEDGLLIAVTEKRTRDELDGFVEFLKSFKNG